MAIEQPCLNPIKNQPMLRVKPMGNTKKNCRWSPYLWWHHRLPAGSKTFTNALHDAFFWSDELPHEERHRGAPKRHGHFHWLTEIGVMFFFLNPTLIVQVEDFIRHSPVTFSGVSLRMFLFRSLKITRVTAKMIQHRRQPLIKHVL